MRVIYLHKNEGNRLWKEAHRVIFTHAGAIERHLLMDIMCPVHKYMIM